MLLSSLSYLAACGGGRSSSEGAVGGSGSDQAVHAGKSLGSRPGFRQPNQTKLNTQPWHDIRMAVGHAPIV